MMMMMMETMETCKAHVIHNECSQRTIKKFTKLKHRNKKEQRLGYTAEHKRTCHPTCIQNLKLTHTELIG
jgi:cell fate (sporulation/competence/biofilm development) regulator YlbF (YheA/YmcA/DUF963 family)